MVMRVVKVVGLDVAGDDTQDSRTSTSLIDVMARLLRPNPANLILTLTYRHVSGCCSLAASSAQRTHTSTVIACLMYRLQRALSIFQGHSHHSIDKQRSGCSSR
jgi:hypothetical protein